MSQCPYQYCQLSSNAFRQDQQENNAVWQEAECKAESPVPRRPAGKNTHFILTLYTRLSTCPAHLEIPWLAHVLTVQVCFPDHLPNQSTAINYSTQRCSLTKPTLGPATFLVLWYVGPLRQLFNAFKAKKMNRNKVLQLFWHILPNRSFTQQATVSSCKHRAFSQAQEEMLVQGNLN